MQRLHLITYKQHALIHLLQSQNSATQIKVKSNTRSNTLSTSLLFMDLLLNTYRKVCIHRVCMCNNSDVTWAFRQLITLKLAIAAKQSRLLPRKACNISFVALREECCPRLRLRHTSTPHATKLMLHAFLDSNLYTCSKFCTIYIIMAVTVSTAHNYFIIFKPIAHAVNLDIPTCGHDTLPKTSPTVNCFIRRLEGC